MDPNALLKPSLHLENFSQKVEEKKRFADFKLEKAKPALQKAEESLQTINPADIATVRRLGRPPNLIMRIMDSVLILCQEKLSSISFDLEKGSLRPSWAEAQKVSLLRISIFLTFFSILVPSFTFIFSRYLIFHGLNMTLVQRN